MNYNEANDILGKKDVKRIAPNTWLKRVGSEFHIVLYATTICVIHSDRIILNSGGFRTVTTKERLNRYSPVKVYQHKGIWFLGQNIFEDGATIPTKGIK